MSQSYQLLSHPHHHRRTTPRPWVALSPVFRHSLAAEQLVRPRFPQSCGDADKRDHIAHCSQTPS